MIAVKVQAASLTPGQRVIVGGRSGRKVIVLRDHEGELRCLDYACFHHGGDLGAGDVLDIEDAGTVLRCPAHGYCVRVATGEHVEQDAAGAWQSRGVVQRTHAVSADADGQCLLQINESEIELQSDKFNISPSPSLSPPRAASSLAFQSRKASAVNAVRAKLELQHGQATLPELLAQERARPAPMHET